MTRSIIASAWGVLFGLGLGITGLPRADVIQGALDFTGAWNPALYVAVVVAVTIYQVAFRFARRRTTPLCAEAFAHPHQRRIDGRLVLGAALFGAGWGLAGMCPGGTLVALPGGDPRAIVFMLVVIATIRAHAASAASHRGAQVATRGTKAVA